MSTSFAPSLAAQTLDAPVTEPAASPALAARSGRFHHPELDGLRFFAFLAVFLDHSILSGSGLDPFLQRNSLMAWPLTLLRCSHAGVELFFVLSSYLITELLLRERQARGTIAVGPFYARRCLRIWPLYYSFLAVTFVLRRWLMPAGTFDSAYLPWFLLFVGNWPMSLGGLSPCWEVSPLWSISVEEQFYLVCPLLLKRLRPRWLMAAAVGCLILPNLVRYGMVANGGNNALVYNNTFCRLDAFALGALIALALKGAAPTFSRTVRWLIGAGGLLLIVAAVRNFETTQIPRWADLALYPLVSLGAALLLLATLQPQGAATGLCARPLLVRLGRISYGLYVFHMVAFLVIGIVPGLPQGIVGSLLKTTASFGITVALASLSYRFLEHPFLKLKERFTYISSRPLKG